MKAEYVNPFLTPAKRVWEKELGCELDLEEYEADLSAVTVEDITAVIRIQGLLDGYVLYGFDEETALAVVSEMMGEDVEEIDNIGYSALGELANMISGNATTELAVAGYHCQISPPMIFKSPGVRFAQSKVQQILVVFDSDIGPLHVRVSLVEKPDADGLDWLWQEMYYGHKRRPR